LEKGDTNTITQTRDLIYFLLDLDMDDRETAMPLVELLCDILTAFIEFF